MADDAPSNRPRPVRAGAAPLTAGTHAPVGDRFDVALTFEAGEGVTWQVRVAGRALSGRVQTGRSGDGVAELLLLVFTREGGDEPEFEALAPAAALRGPDGSLAPAAVEAAFAEAVPFRGASPDGDGFFDGTRRRRER